MNKYTRLISRFQDSLKCANLFVSEILYLTGSSAKQIQNTLLIFKFLMNHKMLHLFFHIVRIVALNCILSFYSAILCILQEKEFSQYGERQSLSSSKFWFVWIIYFHIMDMIKNHVKYFLIFCHQRKCKELSYLNDGSQKCTRKSEFICDSEILFVTMRLLYLSLTNPHIQVHILCIF